MEKVRITKDLHFEYVTYEGTKKKMYASSGKGHTVILTLVILPT